MLQTYHLCRVLATAGWNLYGVVLLVIFPGDKFHWLRLPSRKDNRHERFTRPGSAEKTPGKTV
jgi:hypothetical protein